MTNVEISDVDLCVFINRTRVELFKFKKKKKP